MTPERWKQIKETFHSALELEAGQRSHFLATACGEDVELRQEVESLIAAHEREGSFIERPAYEAATQMFNERALSKGQMLGHYEILATLGVGGMGEVYAARDTKLHRNVALKVLPSGNSGDEESQRRLLREARAAAALDHPNICGIYEVGEANSQSYIAMQYVDGETLAARMARHKLTTDEAVRLSLQIAEALAEAHSYNIIHRDVKPANIMTTQRGQVKVLDFGLAKNLVDNVNAGNDDQTKSLLTTPGMILGTAPYMSPEQVRGEVVDARTDIFSFGTLLYEMLSGQQPFAHPSVAETIGAILHHQPPVLAESDDVPSALQNLVAKCLAKDRAKRYQSMLEVVNDLTALANPSLQSKAAVRPVESPGKPLRGWPATRFQTAVLLTLLLLAGAGLSFGVYRWLTHKPSAAIDSIAVLPFTNANTDQNIEYLSDGITENLINSLSHLPQLKVMSRNSVFQYRGKETDAQKVGKELGVRAVLKGEVSKAGDQLIISVELVDTNDNTSIWGHRYTRPASAIITTEIDIAREVVDKLRLKLSAPEQQQLSKRPTENAEAYQFYLRGRSNANRQAPDALHEAIRYYDQAIERDPNFALAYAGLAQAYLELGMFYEAPRDTMPQAKLQSLKALALDNSLVDGHVALGLVNLLYDWDFSAAERELSANGDVNPKAVETFSCSAHLLEAAGHGKQAEQQIRRALVTDPLSVSLNTELGCNSYYARQFDAAISENRDALQLDQRNFLAYWGLARAFGQKKMYQEAINELKTAETVNGFAPTIIVAERGYVYAAWGRKAEALKMIAELERMKKQTFVDPYLMATIYAGLRDKEKAFAWLEKSYEIKSSFITSMKSEPKFDDLRSDSRFASLLRRVGLDSAG